MGYAKRVNDEYGTLREEDVSALVPLLSWSFCNSFAEVEPWILRGGVENFRVLKRQGKLVSCLLLIPMGQFFGGRRVQMTGIAAVATAADARGTGAALAIMREMMFELSAKHTPLSTLYPATRTLYRRVGYEPAGGRYEARVRTATLPAWDRSLGLRPMTDADEGAVRTVYTAHAKHHAGFLDRGPYVWQRIKNPRGGEVARGFVVETASNLEGYIILYAKRLPNLHHDLLVTDLVATTHSAARRLVTFLADHGTLGDTVRLSAAPDDPLVHLLPAVGCEQQLLEHWMLRIVDLPAALAARGYPERLSVELELDVKDDLVPANAGRFLVSVANGRAEVHPGGRGRLRIDVRGLAALYSGHLMPRSLVVAGLVEGSEEDLARAASVFAGVPPSMPDMF
jgi:predicted acetyltransferase